MLKAVFCAAQRKRGSRQDKQMEILPSESKMDFHSHRQLLLLCVDGPRAAHGYDFGHTGVNSSTNLPNLFLEFLLLNSEEGYSPTGRILAGLYHPSILEATLTVYLFACS